jgi:rhodanese-related sulfurtransferase
MNKIPEITVAELAQKLRSQEKFVLLDVRELSELNYAKITDDRVEVCETSRLGSQGLKALPELVRAQDVPVYVMCHHGNRSMQVTAWLVKQGYKNVFNVSGGINEYARTVDKTVGLY